MASEVTKEDLRDLRDTLTKTIETESEQTREAILAFDARLRTGEADSARHGVRLDTLERSDRDQWSEIGKLRNGRSQTSHSRGREAAKMTGALTVIAAIVEGIHQVANLVLQAFTSGGRP